MSRVAVLAIDVLLDVKSDHVIPQFQECFSPASEAAKKVDRERLHFGSFNETSSHKA